MIAEFEGITGVPKERAQFYLESSGWQLEFALSEFFENREESPAEPDEINIASTEKVSQNKSSKKTSSSKFATVIHSDDSDEEGEAYYAGGSERGAGQQIIGPPRKKKDGGDFIQNLFKSAKESGAEVVDVEETENTSQPSVAFRGTGYRLGESEDTSEMIRETPMEEDTTNNKFDVSLMFWQGSNGFTVNDGPLRKIDDPENAEFLKSIREGSAPEELRKMARGRKLNVMMNVSSEDYVEKKKSLTAFSGTGHMLGSPSPSVSSLPINVSSNRSAMAEEVKIDETQPVTNIQIRLADGTRIVTKLNHTHTVADIRQHIVNSRPDYFSSNFILMTTFPNKELTDENVTLQDAQLLNAVIVQRMK